MIGSGQWWYIEDGEGTRFYFEQYSSVNRTTLIKGTIEPETGEYTLGYACQFGDDCSWCPSYKIILRVEATDEDLLADEDALDGAFDRLIEKLEGVRPEHVLHGQIAFTTQWAAEIEVSPAITSITREWDLFDEIPADDQPMDEYTDSTH